MPGRCPYHDKPKPCAVCRVNSMGEFARAPNNNAAHVGAAAVAAVAVPAGGGGRYVPPHRRPGAHVAPALPPGHGRGGRGGGAGRGGAAGRGAAIVAPADGGGGLYVPPHRRPGAHVVPALPPGHGRGGRGGGDGRARGGGGARGGGRGGRPARLAGPARRPHYQQPRGSNECAIECIRMIYDSFNRANLDRDDLIRLMVDRGVLLNDGRGPALFHALDGIFIRLGMRARIRNDAGPDAIAEELRAGNLVMMELGGAGHVIVVDDIGVDDEEQMVITIRDPQRGESRQIHKPAMKLMRPTGRICVVRP